jgi:hypothetical protein
VVLIPLVASALVVLGILLPIANASTATWLWNLHGIAVLEPLGGAVLMALAGLRTHPGRSTSLFNNGLLVGSGLCMFAVFLAYSAPGDSSCGIICGASPGLGVFAGMAGGLLALGAGLAREWKNPPTPPQSASWSGRLIGMAGLAVGGGIVVILATSSFSLVANESKTLFYYSPFFLAPLLVGMIGLTTPIALAVATGHRAVMRGVLVAAGVEGVLSFVTSSALISASSLAAGPAVPVGIVGSLILVAAAALGARTPRAADRPLPHTE